MYGKMLSRSFLYSAGVMKSQISIAQNGMEMNRADENIIDKVDVKFSVSFV